MKGQNNSQKKEESGNLKEQTYFLDENNISKMETHCQNKGVKKSTYVRMAVLEALRKDGIIT